MRDQFFTDHTHSHFDIFLGQPSLRHTAHPDVYFAFTAYLQGVGMFLLVEKFRRRDEIERDIFSEAFQVETQHQSQMHHLRDLSRDDLWTKTNKIDHAGRRKKRD